MKNIIPLVLFTLCCHISFSQDSLNLTLAQCEEAFLKKNGLLLSMQFHISEAKAQEIQAGLFNNPVFTAEIAAHGGNDKWFDAGRNGQKAFNIDQLIALAGKRNKKVLLAREQTNEASLSYYDLMRTLKYELHQNFYSIAYANELVQKYDEQMRLLQLIITAYDEQAVKKNVPLKDAVRLKTEYIQLSADRNAIIMESIGAQQELRLLLDTTATIVPLAEPAGEKSIPSPDALIEKATKNRTDLQLEESHVKQEQLNYNYQKSLAVPDLNVGAGYDQNGSYVPNFYSIHAAVELPFFNRNQGNIKASKAAIKAAELVRDYKQNAIGKEVLGSIARVQEAEREYRISQQSFNKDFPEVNRTVIENFNKGNISILEFMDFFENYNSAIRQINQLQKQRQLAWEELEFTIGTQIE